MVSKAVSHADLSFCEVTSHTAFYLHPAKHNDGTQKLLASQLQLHDCGVICCPPQSAVYLPAATTGHAGDVMVATCRC